MSLDTVVRSVAGRLSLREPQVESLRKLAAALEAVPALRDHQARSPKELTAMVEALKVMFPQLSDFEHDFPSLCFALAGDLPPRTSVLIFEILKMLICTGASRAVPRR